jgi:hypothetical protein
VSNRTGCLSNWILRVHRLVPQVAAVSVDIVASLTDMWWRGVGRQILVHILYIGSVSGTTGYRSISWHCCLCAWYNRMPRCLLPLNAYVSVSGTTAVSVSIDTGKLSVSYHCQLPHCLVPLLSQCLLTQASWVPRTTVSVSSVTGCLVVYNNGRSQCLL